jgi:Ca2+-binding EF-hand superfamily protein
MDTTACVNWDDILQGWTAARKSEPFNQNQTQDWRTGFVMFMREKGEMVPPHWERPDLLN